MAYEDDRYRALGSGVRAFLEGFFDLAPTFERAPLSEGTLERVAVEQQGRVLRFERRLKHPVREVWSALTEPERLEEWLAHTESKMTEGSRIKLEFENTGATVYGTVTEFNPPNLLEYTWEDQEEPEELPEAARLAGNGNCIQELTQTRVRWILRSMGGGTMLELNHILPESNPGSKRAAGEEIDRPIVLASWHNHLDGLTEGLGRRFKGERREEWPWSRWEELRDRYAQSIG